MRRGNERDLFGPDAKKYQMQPFLLRFDMPSCPTSLNVRLLRESRTPTFFALWFQRTTSSFSHHAMASHTSTHSINQVVQRLHTRL